MTIVVIFGVVLAGSVTAFDRALVQAVCGRLSRSLRDDRARNEIVCNILPCAGNKHFRLGVFTALNDGGFSAVLSFGRTLVFQVSAVFLLPLLLGLDGIWLAVVAAELLALVVTVVFFRCEKKKKYGYA